MTTVHEWLSYQQGRAASRDQQAAGEPEAVPPGPPLHPAHL